jgi:hypothetical protein
MSPEQSTSPPRIVRSLDSSVRGGALHEVALVAVALLAYFAIRNSTAGSPDEAFANARHLVDLERWLGIDWERTAQSAVVGNDVATMLTNWVYIWGHWPVILSVAAVLYALRRERYYLLRNAIFISGAIGFLFFALLPVAPPRLVGGLGLVDTVTEQSNAYRALQPPGLTNQYAALPSLHVGWNVLVGIVLLLTTANLAVRVFAVASPLAMGFAVVATANHYVIDVAAGVAVVLVGLAAALAVENRKTAATLARGGTPAAGFGALRERDVVPVPRRAPRREPPRRPAGRREPGRAARRG